jgi:hypothetical protein
VKMLYDGKEVDLSPLEEEAWVHFFVILLVLFWFEFYHNSLHY